MESNMKKDYQKVVKMFRQEYGFNGEYPKAMMTAQQMRNGTATINCGRAEFGESLAPQVKEFAPFVEWCKTYGIKTTEIEIVREASYMKPQYQIRVTY